MLGTVHTSAGREVVEDLGDHAPEVVEARQHEPPMDVLEGVIEDPKFLAVLAHKCAVFGDPDIGLDQTQVGSDT